MYNYDWRHHQNVRVNRRKTSKENYVTDNNSYFFNLTFDVNVLSYALVNINTLVYIYKGNYLHNFKSWGILSLKKSQHAFEEYYYGINSVLLSVLSYTESIFLRPYKMYQNWKMGLEKMNSIKFE